MTTGQEKIITALRERRQIEEDVRAMLAAGTEAEFRQRARAIAAAGAAVIPAIVHNLDRADNRLLAALGTVASYVDHEAMARALRRAAQQPERSRQGRRGAVALLERFLGEEVGDELRAGLGSSEGPELAALDEVLERGPQNPALAAEYVQGLDQQDPDVVLTVVQVLAAEGPAERAVAAVELLRMIAQDVRGEIAAAALRALGARQEPEAAVALQTLLPATAPELRAVADRSLRKLQFRGVPVAPLPRPEPGWRALVSPVDGMGEQSVWLVMGHGLQARFLNVLIGDRAGAVQAAAHASISVLALPPPRPEGHVHDVALPGGAGSLLLVEAPFDLGRRLVRDALDRNRATQVPVAAALRLFSPWLWGYAGAEALPGPRLPALGPDDSKLAARAGALLEHPAFSTWAAPEEVLWRLADELVAHPGQGTEKWVWRLAADLYPAPVARVIAARLAAMSEWLAWARDDGRARLALAAAEALATGAPQDQPFIQALVRRDLALARAGAGRADTPEGESNAGG